MKKDYFYCMVLLLLIFAASPSKLSGASGTKTVKLKLYGDSDKTTSFDFSLPVVQVHYSQQEDKQNFGLSFTSEKLNSTFPIIIKTGNLSAGGIISKMNNPLLSSSISPFSTGISSANGITASLPGSSSFSKPISHFLQTGFNLQKSNNLQNNTNVFYTPDAQTLAFSTLTETALFHKKLKLALSVCGGFFPYDENTSSSWFLKSPYYQAGNHFCSFYQFSISLFNFYTCFSSGIYETPFGTYSILYKTENSFSTRHFLFNFSGAYNSNDETTSVITSSDKKLTDYLQIRAGVQYKYTAGSRFPVFVKTGLQSYLNVNLSESEHPFKLAAGIQLTSHITTFSITTAASGLLDSTRQKSISTSFKTGSFQIKNLWYLNIFSPGITYNSAFTPSEDFSSLTVTSKINFTLNFSCIPALSSSTGISLTNKDGEYTSRKFSCSITSKLYLPNITIILKFSADNTF